MQTLCWRKPDSNLYGAFPCQGAFSRGWHLIANCCLGFSDGSLFGAGKAVLRSLIAPQVSRRLSTPAEENSVSTLGHAIGEMLFLCSAEGRFSVPACRSTCKKNSSAVLGQACPGSEQEGPARVAQCPHERRSGARGRCLFAHRGKPGWHSVAVFEHAASSRGHGSFRGLRDMSEPQRGVGEAGTAMSRARSTR